MSKLSHSTRLYREKMLSDPYRPGYHFAAPDGNAYPGDPNGAFFADGRYHLMYLYRRDEPYTYRWGHMSSLDLLHWRHHPDALIECDGDGGCFSGGAFVDDDGTAYLSYWMVKAAGSDDKRGIAIARSTPPYDEWEILKPIAIPSDDTWGIAELDGEHISCADPSNIWKSNGYYYMQTGNLPVLNKYGRDADSDPHYRGGWTDLFRSRDMTAWEFVGRFYNRPSVGDDIPDDTEDAMCPTLLPLPDKKSGGVVTDKYLQTFISHNRGGQYYIGTLDGEHFNPTEHGRFTWKDKHCFAPEAMLDDKNRHIAWFWLLEDIKGEYATNDWSGVYSFPRVFWYDGGLKMAPADELDRLQYNPQCFDIGELDGTEQLALKNGEAFLLRLEATPRGTALTVRVRAELDMSEYTDITVDFSSGRLIVDTTHNADIGMRVREEAPFYLADGEKLSLDIFVDKTIFEVYANERQAICRRAYPSSPKTAVNVFVIADGSDLGCVNTWEMMPTNMY